MKLHTQIALALVAGALLGAFAPGAARPLSFLGEIFIGGLKMLIMPLILASMVTGVSSIGSPAALGRLGLYTLSFYLASMTVAVVVGLVLVNIIAPGEYSPDGEVMQALSPVAETAEPAQALPALLAALPPSVSEVQRAQLRDRFERHPPQTRDELQRLVQAQARSYELEARLDRERGAEAAASARKKVSIVSQEPMTVGSFLRAQIDKILVNPFLALTDTGSILAVIVFSLMLGVALVAVGEAGAPLVAAFGGLNAAMMLLTEWFMKIAPVGVFALMANAIAESGPRVLLILAAYMLTVVVGLVIQGAVILPAALHFLGRQSVPGFVRDVGDALAVAFSSASSSATLPLSLECLERKAGYPPRIAGFVLPLGATINMDGTALYEAVAAVFIAQLYGFELSMGQQVLVALTATLAAIGAAGIPSAGTVTMVMVLGAVGLPLEGIGLILAVDRVLDMCRTTVNVWGDMVGVAVVTRLAGEAPQRPA